MKTCACHHRLDTKSIGHFTLPQEAWWKEYYQPLEVRLDDLRKQYASDAAALEVIEGTQQEIDLYERYSDCYGYEFYVVQNRL
jgi:hypothetical protein